MTLIDDRGRVFGKVNLIDALVGVFILALIPLAYGAFVLFRVPAPTITSITPAQVLEHGKSSVQVAGEHLRPFLLARVGPLDSLGFFVQSPTLAEIKLPDLPAGTYDIALYDQGQELIRRPGALTILPVASVSGRFYQEAVGAFVGLDAAGAALIQHNSRFELARQGEQAPPVVEVIALRPFEPGTQRMPAIVRLDCPLINMQCQINGTALARNATIKINDQASFLIESFGLADLPGGFASVATIRARFVAVPEILNVLKAGDVDVGAANSTDRAALMEVGAGRQMVTARTKIEERDRPRLELDQQQVEFLATLRVPVLFTSSGWIYKEKPVKVGSLFTFEAVSGVMIGWIVDMKLGPQH
jgi:hypothetical protein